MKANDLLDIFGGFAGLGVLAAGIGFAYAQLKSGGNKAKDDLISTLKETIVVEKEKVERLAEEKQTLIISHQQQINELSAKIGKLQGLHEANEKKIQEYVTILQGRSPEQRKFMDEMLVHAEVANKYIMASSKILDSITKRLDAIEARCNKHEKTNYKQ